jgi:hypothetical protein
MRGSEGVRTAERTIAQMNEHLLTRVREWIAPHARNGRLKKMPFDVFYALCLGGVQEFGRLWLAGRTATPPQRAATMLAEAAWNAVKGPKGE